MADAKFDPAVDTSTIQINGVNDGPAEDQDAYVTENKEFKDKIKRLTKQIEKLEKDLVAEEERRVQELVVEKNQAAEDKKALAAISARAVELETELFRLQHDFFSATSERDDLFGKLQRLQVAFEEAESANRERDSRIGILEQEKASVAKESAETGRRIRKLEEELKGKVLELRKVENEKGGLEERLKHLDEKSKGLEKSLEEFKQKNLEMEKGMEAWRKENWELEQKVVALERQLEKEEEEEENKKEKNLSFAWPAATAAVVAAAAAIFYLKYTKQAR